MAVFCSFVLFGRPKAKIFRALVNSEQSRLEVEGESFGDLRQLLC